MIEIRPFPIAFSHRFPKLAFLCRRVRHVLGSAELLLLTLCLICLQPCAKSAGNRDVDLLGCPRDPEIKGQPFGTSTENGTKWEHQKVKLPALTSSRSGNKWHNTSCSSFQHPAPKAPSTCVLTAVTQHFSLDATIVPPHMRAVLMRGLLERRDQFKRSPWRRKLLIFFLRSNLAVRTWWFPPHCHARK